MKIKFLALLTCSFFFFVLAGVAGATTIRSAVGVTANTMGEFDASTQIINVSNQSGLSSNFVSGVTDFDTYLAGNPTHTYEFFNNEWFGSDGNLTGYVDFDLGDAYFLDRIALWNENSAGISSLDVYTSIDSTFTTSFFGGNFSPTDNPTFVDYPADIFSLNSTALARYVRIDILGVQDAQFNNNGMGEIAFSTSPVPEPATMFLLGTGLVGVAGAARRKKKYQA